MDTIVNNILVVININYSGNPDFDRHNNLIISRNFTIFTNFTTIKALKASTLMQVKTH